MQDESSASLEHLRARWAEQYVERPPCPDGCVGKTWHDGSRSRKATLLVDAEPVYVDDASQRRKRCCVCRRPFVHRPEGITSSAHYQPCVVSQVLTMLATEPEASTTSLALAVGCVRSTVRRWAARVAALAEPAALASAIAEEAGEPVLPAVPTSLAAPLRSPRLSALVLRALTVLVLIEALASLRGLGPPALAHAASLIPANAPSPQIRGDPSRPA